MCRVPPVPILTGVGDHHCEKFLLHAGANSRNIQKDHRHAYSDFYHQSTFSRTVLTKKMMKLILQTVQHVYRHLKRGHSVRDEFFSHTSSAALSSEPEQRSFSRYMWRLRLLWRPVWIKYLWLWSVKIRCFSMYC